MKDALCATCGFEDQLKKNCYSKKNEIVATDFLLPSDKPVGNKHMQTEFYNVKHE